MSANVYIHTKTPQPTSAMLSATVELLQTGSTAKYINAKMPIQPM